MANRARRALLTGLAFAFAFALAPGCRPVGLAFGPTPAAARVAADEFGDALARRFGPQDVDPGLAAFRPRVAAAALSPSRVFDVPSAWPEHGPDTRSATYAGAPGPGARYRMALQAGAPPSRPGDYRGRLQLRKLGEGEFEWTLREELAVGRLPASAAAQALTAALLAVEQAPLEGGGGADALRAALPRASAALGRAFALERVDLRRHAQGGTVVLLGARLHTPALASQGFPGYARFLDTYGARVRYKISVEDPSGAPFWQVDVHDGRLLLTLRSLRGDLAPLSGAPRPMPDELRLRSEFSTAAGLFRVGLSDLLADVRLVRAGHEKSFEARFRREPEWRLPFVVRPLLRASLRRPFEGPGARLAFALRDAPGEATLLVRDYSLAVRESWLVRWLGGLGSDAVAAFRRDAEEQADRFTFEALDALRRDLLAQIDAAPK